MNKLIEIIKTLVRYALFLCILYWGVLMGKSNDPDDNWIIKFLGFMAWWYIWGKLIFPQSDE